MNNIFNLMQFRNFTSQKRTIIIGNFDGVHLGHKFLIEEAKKIALKSKSALSALTFIPHSRMLISPGESCNLFEESDKYEKLSSAGVEDIFVVKNNQAFFNYDATNFIENILIKKLNCTNLVVGADFKFGKNRVGNVEMLQKYAGQGKFILEIIDRKFTQVDAVVSSTNIRKSLLEGMVDRANNFLGYEYFITGKVIEGKKIATTLGYPTVNLDLRGIFVPKYGVYSAKMEYEGKIYLGVVNIGITPHFKEERPKLEMHIFDFDINLYGKTVKIFPHKYQRAEQKFLDIDSLIKQIDEDCEIARNCHCDYF